MSIYLQTILKRAESKLPLESKQPPVESLKAYQEFLDLERQHLALAHEAGDSGLEVAQKRSTLMSVLLRHMLHSAIHDSSREFNIAPEKAPLTLIAVGGFGRGELNPHSDIDIVFAYGKHKDKSKELTFITSTVEKVLYPLWDLGLKVGHASRTLDEMIDEGKADWQTFTSLLEVRHLAGSEELFSTFQRRFERLCLKGSEQKYLRWRMEDQSERHQKFGNTPFVQEPHIKNGCGGLRDYQNILWMARVKKQLTSMKELEKHGYLTRKERNQLDDAYDFLLRIRTQIHLIENRPSDIITLRLQGEVAQAFAYDQPHILRKIEALMREYYQHARHIFLITEMLGKRLHGEGLPQKPFWNLLPAKLRKEYHIDGFKILQKELHIEQETAFQEDPIRLLTIFQTMQTHQVEISPITYKQIREDQKLFTRALSRDRNIQETFLHILRRKGQVGKTLRAMHECGILGRMIPEFAPITCLVQHEFFHLYTADEHTLICLEQLDALLDQSLTDSRYHELFVEIKKSELLYLALLLHDVGKAEITQDHAQASAQLTSRVAKRFGFKGRTLKNLIFLVFHHGTLSEFALRRNLDDPETIREFARIVEDQERLTMLMLLAYADAKGVRGNDGWTSWKEVLVWQLFMRTQAMLEGEEEFQKQVSTNRKAVRKAVRTQVPSEISKEEFDVHFEMMPEFYLNHANEPTIARQIETAHRFIIKHLQSQQGIITPEITWKARPHQAHTEVIMVSWDKTRLFHHTAGSFAYAGLNILSADIFTRMDDLVVDTFSICNERQEAVTDERDKKLFEDTLSNVLGSEPFDLENKLKENISAQRSKHAKGFTVASKINIDNYSMDKVTLLQLQLPDFPGLLYFITSFIAELDLNITHARIATEKGVALDTFYLVESDGSKFEDKKRHQILIRKIRHFLKEIGK